MLQLYMYRVFGFYKIQSMIFLQAFLLQQNYFLLRVQADGGGLAAIF